MADGGRAEEVETNGTTLENTMIANYEAKESIPDGENAETVVMYTEELTVNNEKIPSVMTDDKKIADVTAIGSKQSQQNFLRRAYAAQSNPPKELYMRSLVSEKFWPRNLRKIGCTPIKTETLEIVE
jgi:hypothetical protein